MSIHVILILGGVTMVYPFLLMISGSLKSNVDSNTLDTVPTYLYDDDALYRKWVEAQYNEQVGEYNFCARDKAYTFRAIEPPARPVARRFADWTEFLRARGVASIFEYGCGNVFGSGVRAELTRKFVRELKEEPDVRGDIEALNIKYGATYTDWDSVSLQVMNPLRRGALANLNDFSRRMVRFLTEQPEACRYYYSLDAFFTEQTLRPRRGQRIRQLNAALGTKYRSWAEVTLARALPDGPLREDWLFFVRNRLNLPFIKVSDAALPAYRGYLAGKYKTIALYNARYGGSAADFDQVQLPAECPREGIPLLDWEYFVTNLAAPEQLSIASLEFEYRDFLRKKFGEIGKLAAAHGFGYGSLAEVPLLERLSEDNLGYRDDWLAFVAERAGIEWLRPDSGANSAWRDFIAKPYTRAGKVDWAALNRDLGADYRDANDVFLPLRPPRHERLAERWRQFVLKDCPRNLLVLDTVAAAPAWRVFLQARHGTVEALNRAYGLVPASFDAVNLPTAEIDWFHFQARRSHARREFLVRNYATVFEMMLYNGYAIRNTVWYCVLAVVCALIVNPMAAYALSRYKPPSQYKLLLFLMLTMAFPPMVLGIPTFLLIRNLGLLNTFLALVLPGIANGYAVFMLKGFFDSLPRELYESAQLDGASEWTMFWHITMSTSKPILAVIALSAFQHAYANFMLAFLLCQNPKMWTLMVHIYQLQQRSCQGVVFASIVVGAIPTLLMFIFCQNIIMRGIVVPTEK